MNQHAYSSKKVNSIYKRRNLARWEHIRLQSHNPMSFRRIAVNACAGWGVGGTASEAAEHLMPTAAERMYVARNATWADVYSAHR